MNKQTNKHPTQTPEYWERLALEEMHFAASKRKSRAGTVQSILAHERNAAEYAAWAKKLRENEV